MFRRSIPLKFAGKHMAGVSFLFKLQAEDLQPYYEKAVTHVFLWDFAQFLKTPILKKIYFEEQLLLETKCTKLCKLCVTLYIYFARRTHNISKEFN